MSSWSSLKQWLAGTIAVAGILCTGLAGAHATEPAPRHARAATAASAAWDWSGFYVGGNAGGAKQAFGGTSNFFQNDPKPSLANNPQSSPALSSSSGIGGVHLGYNWLISRILLGVEGDWQWMQSGSSFCRQTDNLLPPCVDGGRGFLTIQGETRGIGTVRGRLGYTLDRVLVYGTAGVAFAELRGAITADCRVAGCANSGARNLSTENFSTLKTGWVVGFGAEVMLSPNWIVRSEYLHVDVGTTTSHLNLALDNCSQGPCGASWSRSQHYDIGRVGLSYKFGGGPRPVE